METSRTVLVWPLAVAPGLLVRPAQALEIDQIQVKSTLREPLLAEIPIVCQGLSALRLPAAQVADAATLTHSPSWHLHCDSGSLFSDPGRATDRNLHCPCVDVL